MSNRKYPDEFKEQVVKECRDIGNIALVSRRHGISKHTVYSWVNKAKMNGSIKPLSREKEKQFKEVKNRLEKVSTDLLCQCK